MSQDNVQLYRRAIAAWNEGDLATWLEGISSDWEFQTTGAFPGFKPVYRGRDEAVEFWETLREPWQFFRVEVERVFESGDRVVGLLKFHGRGKASGIDTTLEYAHVATTADGVITRLQGFLSHDEALEAAGLASGKGG